MRKILTATLAAGALAAGVAQAATTTTTFQVTATVPAVCKVSAVALPFPNYTPLGGNKSGSTNIAVLCTNKTPFKVALDKGSTVGGAISQRLMVGLVAATNTLQYNLYTDPAFTTLFGDGTTGVQVSGTGVGLSTAVNVPVYGQLPDSAANQLVIPDSFSDTITVTVSY
jgi:spore coat protein U-like protein